MMGTALISLLFVVAARACGPTHPGSTPGGGSAADGTTSPTSVECQTPENLAGVTIGEIANSDLYDYKSPQSGCASCTSGTRSFYETSTDVQPDAAMDDSQGAAFAQCTDAPLCVCLADGTCCSVGATAPEGTWLIPYCAADGTCSTEAVLQGENDASLTCGGTTYTVGEQFDANGDYLPLGEGNYLIADYVSCTDDCVAPTCQGPTT